MTDSSVKKVNASTAPIGAMGQKYLASGVRMAMRMWEEEPSGEASDSSERQYETIGYVIDGRAELELEGQKLLLEPGDCWVVPAGARHSYLIRETFSAIEATSPPARVHARDESVTGLE
jgi:quercetin dioxygenase-like cupin family protein